MTVPVQPIVSTGNTVVEVYVYLLRYIYTQIAGELFSYYLPDSPSHRNIGLPPVQPLNKGYVGT